MPEHIAYYGFQYGNLYEYIVDEDGTVVIVRDGKRFLPLRPEQVWKVDHERKVIDLGTAEEVIAIVEELIF